MWDRFQRLGGNIYAIAMDEPLVCTRKHIDKPDDYAVQETADFVALVRRHYPQILVGDIETYPSFPVGGPHLVDRGPSEAISREEGPRLDFYCLDVDWVTFTIRNVGSWREVKKLEQYCRSRKLPFSLIYWASWLSGFESPRTGRRLNLVCHADAAGIRLLRSVDGSPDQYVIESWVGASFALCARDGRVSRSPARCAISSRSSSRGNSDHCTDAARSHDRCEPRRRRRAGTAFLTRTTSSRVTSHCFPTEA